jgi:hypothetical protein
MASRTNKRELFNLSQPKSYMQTMLVGSRSPDQARPADRRWRDFRPGKMSNS